MEHINPIGGTEKERVIIRNNKGQEIVGIENDNHGFYCLAKDSEDKLVVLSTDSDSKQHEFKAKPQFEEWIKKNPGYHLLSIFEGKNILKIVKNIDPTKLENIGFIKIKDTPPVDIMGNTNTHWK